MTRRIPIACSCLALMMPLSANAQSAAAPSTTSPESDQSDIIVTAQRREERTQDVPISITSISGEMLTQANVQELGDIAKLSPATRFDYQANFVQPTIRGVGSLVIATGGNTNVGIYVDGFYTPSATSGDFDLLGVESVQVLKGPQGTLFGRNTTGGAILVTTTKPNHEWRGMAQASYERFNSFKGQAHVSGGLTQNIAADIQAQYSRGDGYLTNIIANGPKNPSRFENWSIRAGVGWTLSDNLSFLLRYTHQSVNDATNLAGAPLLQDGILYATFQGLPEQIPASLVPTGYRQVALNPGEEPRFLFNADVFQLTGSLDLSFAKLTSYTQYRDEVTHMYSDNDFTAADINYQYLRLPQTTFTQELILASKPGGRLNWTAGLFYFNFDDSYDPVSAAANQNFNPAYYVLRTHARSQSLAAYVDATYEVVNRLFLTLGARYTHDRHSEGRIDFLPFVGPEQPAVQAGRITPRAVIRYALDDHSSVYASYTQGYKAPLGDTPNGGRRVNAETMDAFEVGYKYGSRRLSLSLASWYYNYKNLQITLSDKGLSQLLNAADARIYGVEGELRYQATPNFEVTVSAAYVDAKYKSFPTANKFGLCADPIACSFSYGQWILFPVDASGFTMQRAPKFTATVSARYAFDLGGGRMSLFGNLYHTSKFFFDPAQQFYQNGYNLLGLRAEWTAPSERVSVVLYGENLLGEKYLRQVLASSPTIAGMWGPPRTWGVSMRYKFGS